MDNIFNKYTLDERLNPASKSCLYVLKRNYLWSISSLHGSTLRFFNLMKSSENKLMPLANDFNNMFLVLKITIHFIFKYNYRNGHKIYVNSWVPRKSQNFI
jgi:hypothetical protein